MRSCKCAVCTPEINLRAFRRFNTVLDSRKTGHRVKVDVLKRDKRDFKKELPLSLQSRKGDNFSQHRTDQNLRFKRDRALGEFIIDYLFDAGRKMQDEEIKRYDSLKPRFFGNDQDLLRPWKKVQLWLNDSSPITPDLALIQKHVDDHIKEWQAITQRTSSKSTPWAKNKARVSKSAAQAQYDELARSYAAGPEIPVDSLLACTANVERLKASCAYTAKPKFAWSVAFQALCHIKAEAEGSVAFKAEFADLMSIPASTNRVLEQSRLALAAT